jgi:3-oxoacyl-[acyl-carrier-protein] synthase I
VTANAAVVGAGARTAVGRSLRASAAAVRAGIGHFTVHPFLSDRRGRRINVARAPWLSADLVGSARFVHLAAAAAKEALEPITAAHAPIRAFLGLPAARPGRPDDLEEAIARAFAADPMLRDRIAQVVSISEGHAAAFLALEQACSTIERGEADLCLVGGVDSWLEPSAIEHLLAAGRLRGPSRPWGFVPGEAAAFCVVASSRWIAESGEAAPLSVIASASSTEPAPMGSKRVCTGKGLGEVFERTLGPLRASGERAHRLVGDLNGEPYRVDELGFAVSRSADAIEHPDDVVVPAACWGDVGAASGALFAGLAFAEALSTGSPSKTTLAWSGSEGGLRAAASFRSSPAIEQEEAS